MFGFFRKSKADASQAAVAAQEKQDETPQELQEYAVSDLGRARYEVEHRQFRDFFLENPTGFVDALMAEFGLCELHFEALKHYKVKTRYGAGPYQVATGKTDYGSYIVRGKLPKPEFLGLCYRFYLVFNADFSKLAYYIVESTKDGAQLCELKADDDVTVIGPTEITDWSEATRDQKAAEIDLITRLFHGLPEEPEAEDAEGAEDEAVEAGAVSEEPVSEEPAETEVAEDGEAGEDAEAIEDAEVVEAEVAEGPAGAESETAR